MSDYLEAIIHIPLYTYHMAVAVWEYLTALPWPGKGDVFGSFIIFLILYIPRIIMSAVVPEKKLARDIRGRFIRRRKTVPDTNEHHKAAASVGSIFH